MANAAMKEIKLTKGQATWVDEDDYEYLNQWKWYYHSNGYAARGKKVEDKNTVIMMHRLITNAPLGVDVDHINHNRLDNRRENLRLCTRSQNIQHSSIRSDNRSGYRGVSWDKGSSKWVARIKSEGKHKRLGVFEDITQAARMYDKFAVEYFGSYAVLNFPIVEDIII